VDSRGGKVTHLAQSIVHLWTRNSTPSDVMTVKSTSSAGSGEPADEGGGECLSDEKVDWRVDQGVDEGVDESRGENKAGVGELEIILRSGCAVDSVRGRGGVR
jgi:hypothetical protein